MIGGFEPDGAHATGVFGDVKVDSLLDHIASLPGLPTSNNPANLRFPNVVTETDYYGDTPPSYYDSQDLSELAQVTAQWGGGVPRYALIVAKFAQHILEISGAPQVNIVSASFGSLVARWMIEKDVEGLASQRKVSRWLSAEGVLDGNWAASQSSLVQIRELVEAPSIDVNQMNYGWVSANVHNPRTDASDPNYANILLGTMGSTDDHLNAGVLTAAMLAAGQFQANDGVQGIDDTYFHTVADAAKLEGRLPLRTFYHDDHYGLEDDRGAWAQTALFLTQRRRVTITMTRAQVNDIHESIIFRPAEIVFDSEVFSPTASRWGISAPISRQAFEGAALPIRRYSSNGQSLQFTQTIFDGMVSPEDTMLHVQLGATEIDLELRYGVVETAVQPFLTDVGGGSIDVPVVPGTYTFHASSWNCDLAVDVHDYAFEVGTGSVVVAPTLPREVALRIAPNPSRSTVSVFLVGRAASADSPATLRIFDAAGRLVQRIEGRAGQPFFWDHLDGGGHPVASGVYLYDLEAGGRRVRGNGTFLR